MVLALVFGMVSVSNAMSGWSSILGFQGTTAFFKCYNSHWSGRPENFSIVVKQYVVDATGRFTEYNAGSFDFKWSDLDKNYTAFWRLPFVPISGIMAFRITCWMNGNLVYYTEWMIENGKVTPLKARW